MPRLGKVIEGIIQLLPIVTTFRVSQLLPILPQFLSIPPQTAREMP